MILSLTFSLQHPGPPSSLLRLIDDFERFVLRFFEIIKVSAMPWSPMWSLTRQLYQKHIATEVKLVNGIDADWDACIRSIPCIGDLNAIAFSHNGSAIAVVSRDYVNLRNCDRSGYV
jgi:hypothetical protein